MKNFLFQFLKYVLTFLCLIIMFNCLMYSASSFSSDLIEDNVKKSADIIYKQGDYWSTGFLSVVENVTDGLQINEAYSIDSKNPVESYILIRKNYKKGQTQVVLPDSQGTLVSYSENNFDKDGNPVGDSNYTVPFGKYETIKNYKIVDELKNFIDGKVTISQTYSRYYHGYLAIYRPLLLFLDVTGIRVIMAVCLLVLFFGSAYLTYKKINLRFAVIFYTTLLAFGYTGMMLSLQQGPLLLVTMIYIFIMLLGIEDYSKKRFMYGIFVAACFASFFDFLTTPVLSLTLPLIIFYAYNKEHSNVFNLKIKNFKECFSEIVVIGIIWSLGFALTWFSKFVVTEVFCHTDAIKSGIEQILYRTGGAADNFGPMIEVVVIPHTLKVLIMVCVIFVLSCLISDKIIITKPKHKAFKENVDLLLVGCVPLGWMLVTLNHTINHYDLFTYRNWMIIMMVIFYLITDDKNIKVKHKAKR